jgi:chemotaxis signal transduction protein
VTQLLPTWFDDDVEPVRADGADHLVVRLGSGRYAVRAVDVAEVLPVPVRTRVPGTPAWVSGVANWRGHVLPVVDLRPILGLAISPLPTSARIAVVAVDDVEIGLLAESVTGLMAVGDDLSPAPGSLPEDAVGLLDGVAEGEAGGPVAVISTSGLLALRSRLR